MKIYPIIIIFIQSAMPRSYSNNVRKRLLKLAITSWQKMEHAEVNVVQGVYNTTMHQNEGMSMVMV